MATGVRETRCSRTQVVVTCKAALVALERIYLNQPHDAHRSELQKLRDTEDGGLPVRSETKIALYVLKKDTYSGQGEKNVRNSPDSYIDVSS